MFLTHFEFPTADDEYDYRMQEHRTCFDTYYPFHILSKNQLSMLDFEPITILYGTNGSGKSTALNVIGEKLGLKRDTLYNRTNFYEDYLGLCSYEKEQQIPSESRIVTSDDVFDYMLNIRKMNAGIDGKREDLYDEYLNTRAHGSEFRMKSMADYDELKRVNLARSKTMSKYVRANLVDNVREYSNGESALLYFQERIQENGLYLLDEPENSLSPSRQMELVQYLENAVRFFGCQLIIATHSPFLLALRGAKIYDLNENPVDVKKWQELDEVKEYLKFFEAHREEFKD